MSSTLLNGVNILQQIEGIKVISIENTQKFKFNAKHILTLWYLGKAPKSCFRNFLIFTLRVCVLSYNPDTGTIATGWQGTLKTF